MSLSMSSSSAALANIGREHLPRILILEDDDRIRTELLLCLAEEGFDCLACRTAEEAVHLAHEYNDIAVGIVDIRLPGQSGLDFIAAVRDRDATYMPMHFIVMSGHVDVDNAMQALRLKIDDMLRKPVDPEVLIASVVRSLESVSVELVGRGVAAGLAEEVAGYPTTARIRAPRTDQHNHLIENFLSMLSQELRTPLVPIIGYADELIAGTSEALATRDAGECIRLEAVKLLERIDSILDLSRLMTGLAQPKLATVNPMRLLEMARRNFADAARARSLRIDVDVIEAPTEASIDRAMWVQAVAHVLRNAIEHASPNTTIRCRLDVNEDQLRCSIQNTGRPLRVSEMERATDPFRQGSEGQAREKRGLGLGLALAQRYMALHGGDLMIDSRRFSGVSGVRVILSLPLSPAPVQPASDAWKPDLAQKVCGGVDHE